MFAKEVVGRQLGCALSQEKMNHGQFMAKKDARLGDGGIEVEVST
jgi:hypothetical protein